MGILSFLGRSKNAVPLLEHPALGKLAWSSEEREWQGSHNGLVFSLSYEGGPEPSSELLAYAQQFLQPESLLGASLEREKQQWIHWYPNSAAEVAVLQFEHITFYRHKGKLRIFASLKPEGERGRAWRIEFGEVTCEGLGFDS